jgi:hypothetical protein
MFVKLIEAGPEEKDAEWIAGYLGRVIDEVGAENIDLVVMDNASVCTAAGKLLEAQHIYLTSMGCCAHALDLLLRDACAHAWAKELFEHGRTVVKWVKKRGIPLRVLQQHSKLALLLE